MGFGGEDLKQNAWRSLISFFAQHRQAHSWDQQKPGPGGSQLTEVASCAEMCISPGSSPWDTTTLCSTAHRAWAAFILLPREQHTKAQTRNEHWTTGRPQPGAPGPRRRSPLHNWTRDRAAGSRLQETESAAMRWQLWKPQVCTRGREKERERAWRWRPVRVAVSSSKRTDKK